MKFTHTDVEADRRKPVGSLFLHVMDRDSIPSRVHRVVSARARYDNSLAGLPFSRCASPADGKDGSRRSDSRGRRHFHSRSVPQFSVGTCASRSAAETPHGRSSRSIHPCDHLLGASASLTARAEEAHSTPLHRRRRVPSPRQTHSTNFIPAPATASATTATPLRGRSSYNAQNCQRSAFSRHRSASHLDRSSLVPRAEPATERPVPEPLPPRVRTSGVRTFPERYSSCEDERRRGVRLTKPPPHWRSVNDRQAEFLGLGIAAQESSRLARSRSNPGSVSGQGAPSDRVRWRSGSAVPPPRSFNIITGLPL